MTSKKIERMLAQAGVPEGRCPPYQTTARTMFSAIAWNALRVIPQGQEAEELARNASAFVEHYWTLFRNPKSIQSLRIFQDHNVVAGRNGAIQLKQGMAFRGQSYLPSVRRSSPARSVRQNELPQLAEIVRDITQAACQELREYIPDVTVRVANEGGLTRWGGTTIEVVVDGYAWRALSWSAVEMFNKSRDDLLYDVGYVPHLLHEARRRHQNFLANNPSVVTELADVPAQSGLPITLSTTPYPDQVAGGGWAHVMLHGYGPGGEPATYRIGGISATKSLANWKDTIGEHLKEQRKRHLMYGPKPSACRAKWEIDIVTARLLIEDENGAEALAHAITQGSSRTNAGVELRVAGKHRLLGRGNITDEATWHGTELRIVGTRLPDTVTSAIIGRPIEEIVDSPLLKGAGTIASVRHNTLRGKIRVNIKVKPTMKILNLEERSDNSRSANGA